MYVAKRSRRASGYSTAFKIVLGFAASCTLYLAVQHPQPSYIILLGISAFFRQQPFSRFKNWFSQFCFSPIKVAAAVGACALALNILIPVPAFAQWSGAQDAANTTLGTYLSTDIISLLFTVVFLLLFFLIVGGLMTWGYKAFRNEDAAVPMTAFIVGTVIFVGGEVFSGLFFEGGGGEGGGGDDDG